jgi:type IV pilus assembly protein PilV
MRHYLKPLASRNIQNGFSMLEILISLVIIAIAMLGAAGLQLNVMRLNNGSQSRTQAIFLAADMAERLETNKVGAVAGSYNMPAQWTNVSSVAGTDCTATTCDSPSLAAWDISMWGQSISSLLPNACWGVTTTTVANPITYTIHIGWVDHSDSLTNVTANSCNTYVNQYTTTRTISN